MYKINYVDTKYINCASKFMIHTEFMLYKYYTVHARPILQAFILGILVAEK